MLKPEPEAQRHLMYAALAFLMKASIDGAALVDGVSLNTSMQLEGDMIKALSKYTKPTAFGIQVDSRAWRGDAVLADGPVKQFLDGHQGVKGVLLISFGTAYTPKDYVEECIGESSLSRFSAVAPN